MLEPFGHKKRVRRLEAPLLVANQLIFRHFAAPIQSKAELSQLRRFRAVVSFSIPSFETRRDGAILSSWLCFLASLYHTIPYRYLESVRLAAQHGKNLLKSDQANSVRSFRNTVSQTLSSDCTWLSYLNIHAVINLFILYLFSVLLHAPSCE